MTAPDDHRFVRAAEVSLKSVGDSKAVYVPAQKAIHVLNPTAHLLYEFLETPASREEIILALCTAANADRATVENDIDDVLQEFVDKGILDTSG